jgi:hypothetical protein
MFHICVVDIGMADQLVPGLFEFSEIIKIVDHAELNQISSLTAPKKKVRLICSKNSG